MRLKPLVLVTLLTSSSSAPAQEAKFLDKDPYYWIEQLDSPSPRARRSGAFALGKLGTAAFTHRGIEPLAARIGEQESDADVRDAAAYALGEIALSLRPYADGVKVWTAISPTLLHALSEDKDARVRRSAAYAIGRRGVISGFEPSSLGNIAGKAKSPTPSATMSAAA